VRLIAARRYPTHPVHSDKQVLSYCKLTSILITPATLSNAAGPSSHLEILPVVPGPGHLPELVASLDVLNAIAFTAERTRVSKVDPAAVFTLLDILWRTAQALIIRNLYSRRTSLRNYECVNNHDRHRA
jgi:hypothetical protein